MICANHYIRTLKDKEAMGERAGPYAGGRILGE
jgi:hypothetical protein